MLTPQRIAERVRDHMWSTDRASQGMGMEVAAIGPGTCTMTMTVRADMLNGYGTCQGGLLAALADALALEARVQGELGRAHDFAEGVAAFQQKRPAVFKDR